MVALLSLTTEWVSLEDITVEAEKITLEETTSDHEEEDSPNLLNLPPFFMILDLLHLAYTLHESLERKNIVGISGTYRADVFFDPHYLEDFEWDNSNCY